MVPVTAADLIFWYTGAAAWGIVALLFVLALLLGACWAAGGMYRNAPAWRCMQLLTGFPSKEEQDALQSGFDAATGQGDYCTRNGDVPFAGDWPKCRRWAVRFCRGYRAYKRKAKKVQP